MRVRFKIDANDNITLLEADQEENNIFLYRQEEELFIEITSPDSINNMDISIISEDEIN